MDENDGWLTDHKDLEIIIQEFIFASFLNGPYKFIYLDQ